MITHSSRVDSVVIASLLPLADLACVLVASDERLDRFEVDACCCGDLLRSVAVVVQIDDALVSAVRVGCVSALVAGRRCSWRAG